MFGARDLHIYLKMLQLQTARSRIAVERVVNQSFRKSERLEKNGRVPFPTYSRPFLNTAPEFIARMHTRKLLRSVSAVRAVFVDFIRLLIETIVSTLFVGLSRVWRHTHRGAHKCAVA